MRRNRVGTIALAATLAVGSAAIAAMGAGGAGKATLGAGADTAQAQAAVAKKPLPFETHDLYIEYNATDGDAGLQMSLDNEPAWNRFRLRDPKGRKLMVIKGKSHLRGFGLGELFFESNEPPFRRVPFGAFKKRFPAGRYTFRGRTIAGRRLVGSDRFSHRVPRGPKVTFPTKGAVVDRNNVTIRWRPVTKPRGIKIARYIVNMEHGSRAFSMDLPPSATSADIPPQFLRGVSRGGGEVLARARNGNQTITGIPSFRLK
jgi:hypothetical protein